MNDIGIEKQMIRDFKKALNSNLVEKVTIYCEHMKDGETQTQTWTVGVGETYEDTPILKEMSNQYNIKNYPFANLVVGKNIFKIAYGVTDFRGKKNIKVTYPDGTVFYIVKTAPMAKLSNGYLSWCLLEK